MLRTTFGILITSLVESDTTFSPNGRSCMILGLVIKSRKCARFLAEPPFLFVDSAMELAYLFRGEEYAV